MIDVTPHVTISGDPQHGEYTTNVAMRLSKQLKKSPMEIALQVKEALDKRKLKFDHNNQDQKMSKQHQKGADEKGVIDSLQDIDNIWSSIDRVEIAPPGFINVFLTESALSTQVVSVIKDAERYGTAKTDKVSAKKIVIEYTDPNPFKEFHIGHLISNVTGEALARLKEASGAVVWRADYFGDVGTHVAKSVWGLQKKMSEDHISLSDLEKKPLIERVNYMGQGYALGTQEFEKSDDAKAEIGRLNTVLYVVAQKMWEKEGRKAAINYNTESKVTDQEVLSAYDLYVTGRKWSLEYFETIYKRLGTKFDGYYPESMVGEVGYQYVIDNIGKAFERSEGAVVFRGEKVGLHTRVFINKHNLPTYEAKELGLAPTKYKDFPYDESIIVVGKEIKEYFAVLVAALTEINPKLGKVTQPIFTGMVNLPEGKMSSRFGNVVTVIGLMDRLKDAVTKKIQDFDYSDDQKAEIAEKVAVAALKYWMLRVSLPSDIAFDFDKSLSFDGDSGPYLLYTYTRCKSVLRKAEGSRADPMRGEVKLNAEEHELSRLISFFPQYVAQAATELAPNVLCTYLFQLAQAFNLFYQKHPILDAQEAKGWRLTLTAATAQVLHNGLYFLGISTVERM